MLKFFKFVVNIESEGLYLGFFNSDLMKKDTLQTIAERTGFSKSTVSRVLSGQGRRYRISETAISIIQKEIRACGYTPDLIAKGLRTRRTNTVGLTIPSIENPFFSSLSSSIITRLKKSGYNILLSDSMETEENEREAISSFISRKVDGIIAVPVSSSPDFIESVSASTPVVLIDRYYENTILPYVCTDNYSGARKATEYLLGRGYRNIMAIQGVRTSMPNKERVKGFLDAIGKYGCGDAGCFVTGDAFSVENGIREVEAALSAGRKIDAVFAFSTTILLGVIKSLRAHGLRIPDDVAVISFDDNVFLDYMDPPISRVAQNTDRMGEATVDILMKLMSSSGSGGESGMEDGQMLIMPELIIRGSC